MKKEEDQEEKEFHIEYNRIFQVVLLKRRFHIQEMLAIRIRRNTT